MDSDERLSVPRSIGIEGTRNSTCIDTVLFCLSVHDQFDPIFRNRVHGCFTLIKDILRNEVMHELKKANTGLVRRKQ